MAETTADVRRDIELTRERMTSTLDQLERKLNVVQVIKDHPWPSLALAFGAGLALAGSKADVKAATATVAATGGASSRVGSLLDDAAARLITGVTEALNERVDGWVEELKTAIGAPAPRGERPARTRLAIAETPAAPAATPERAGAGAPSAGVESTRPATTGQFVGVDEAAQGGRGVHGASLAH